MQGSFEKKVQEKLDELRLTPSEPVWKAIEKEIRPEKRRRFPFWIPFIIVMLGGATWWMLVRGGEEGASNATVVSASPNETNEGTAKATPSPLPTDEELNPETNTTSSLTEKSSADQNNQPRKQATGFKYPLAVKPAETRGRNNQTFIAANQGLLPGSNKPKHANSAQEDSTKISIAGNKTTSGGTPKETEIISSNILGINADTTQTVSPGITSNSTTPVDSVAEKAETIEDLPQAKDTVVAKPKLAASKKSWQKIITVSGGWSRYADGELGQNLRADLSSSPVPGYNNGLMGNPSPVKTGTAFQVGFGLKKELHPRWEISIGLQYSHYSTQTKVGEYKAIDTAVIVPNGNLALEGYYKNADQKDYTIRYGILELPVSIGFKPLARLPLTLSAGASYGRLLHANVLQFDRWANIYYTDKEATKKDLFAGFASMQYTILNKAAWSLDAGPVVQYHFSNLHKNSTDKRLFFAGLKTAITF